MDFTPASLTGEGVVSLRLDRLDLSTGKYFVNVGIYSENWESTYDFRWRKSSIQVYSDVKTNNFFSPPAVWSISQGAEMRARESDIL